MTNERMTNAELPNEGGVKLTCKSCEHFIGGGDWNLCCSAEHPTPEEKKKGMSFPCGFLCYEDTEACDMYLKKN